MRYATRSEIYADIVAHPGTTAELITTRLYPMEEYHAGKTNTVKQIQNLKNRGLVVGEQDPDAKKKRFRWRAKE